MWIPEIEKRGVVEWWSWEEFCWKTEKILSFIGVLNAVFERKNKVCEADSFDVLILASEDRVDEWSRAQRPSEDEMQANTFIKISPYSQ